MPDLSVIIPVRGRVCSLSACFGALSEQTQPRDDFEVIIVVYEDAPDNVLAIPDAPLSVRVYSRSTGSVTAACNQGARMAVGQYCLFLSPDVIPAPDLVSEHLRIQRRQAGVIGVGPVIYTTSPMLTDGFARWRAERQDASHLNLPEAGTRVSPWLCRHENLSVPRDIFTASNGFCTTLQQHEGVDLAYRLRVQGCFPVSIPLAVARQQFAGGFETTTMAIEAEGKATVELYARYPELLSQVELGAFNNTSIRAVLLRRLLISARVPARLLRLVNVLIGDRPWKQEWYRFLHSYCYWSGVHRACPDRVLWRRLTGGVPILMYHAFAHRGESTSRYVLRPWRFALQMAGLKLLRYKVIPLREFMRAHREHRLPPARSVVITIDDGYADNWSLAYPILRRHGFPATVFLVSGLIGATNRWDGDDALARRPLLSWQQIHEMLAHGIQIGAHTKTHRSLPTLPDDAAMAEVALSRSELEKALGVPIETFSYPNGAHDERVHELVERVGFLGACCSRPGLNDPVSPMYALRRIEIRGSDSFVRFAFAVLLGLPTTRRKPKAAPSPPRLSS